LGSGSPGGSGDGGNDDYEAAQGLVALAGRLESMLHLGSGGQGGGQAQAQQAPGSPGGGEGSGGGAAAAEAYNSYMYWRTPAYGLQLDEVDAEEGVAGGEAAAAQQ
jgi:hypothetical protein